MTARTIQDILTMITANTYPHRGAVADIEYLLTTIGRHKRYATFVTVCAQSGEKPDSFEDFCEKLYPAEVSDVKSGEIEAADEFEKARQHLIDAAIRLVQNADADEQGDAIPEADDVDALVDAVLIYDATLLSQDQTHE